MEANDLRSHPPFRVVTFRDGSEIIAEDVETEVAARIRFASAIDVQSERRRTCSPRRIAGRIRDPVDLAGWRLKPPMPDPDNRGDTAAGKREALLSPIAAPDPRGADVVACAVSGFYRGRTAPIGEPFRLPQGIPQEQYGVAACFLPS